MRGGIGRNRARLGTSSRPSQGTYRLAGAESAPAINSTFKRQGGALNPGGKHQRGEGGPDFNLRLIHRQRLEQ